MQLTSKSVENYPFVIYTDGCIFPDDMLFITIGTCFGKHAAYGSREITFTKHLSSLEITTSQNPLDDPIQIGTKSNFNH